MKKATIFIMAGMSGSGYLFLNVSGGRLINKQKQLSFFGYEGTLIGIQQILDPFEGKSISKIKLLMKDSKSDEVAQISFSEESWYSQGFFSRIRNVDLSKPFILGVSGSDQNDKVSFSWMKQGGVVVEHDLDFPKPEKTARGKDDYENLIKGTTKVLEIIQENLKQLHPATEAEAPKDGVATVAKSRPTSDKAPYRPAPKPGKTTKTPVTRGTVIPPDSDLPF